LLLLLRGTSLEWLLLRSLLLELVLLLPWISCVLRLLRLRLLLLLPKSLRLARVASELWLHWTSSKASRLRSKSTLKALGLSIWLLLLLLLAILRLPRSGAVAAP
jgi:hypothetical protein